MKTFYTVDYNRFGYVETKIFEDKEEAYSFYRKEEYSDKPVAHVLRNEDSIEAWENKLEEQAEAEEMAERARDMEW